LSYQSQRMSYAALARELRRRQEVYVAMGLSRGERVAVYLEKRLETVSRYLLHLRLEVRLFR